MAQRRPSGRVGAEAPTGRTTDPQVTPELSVGSRQADAATASLPVSSGTKEVAQASKSPAVSPSSSAPEAPATSRSSRRTQSSRTTGGGRVRSSSSPVSAPAPARASGRSSRADSARVKVVQEEGVAPENNVVQDHAAQSHPAPNLDEMIIEAAEDDEDPTEETYLVPQGRGLGGVGLKLLARRPTYDGADDEVVVIERESGKQKMPGSHLWFRGGEDRSWRSSAPPTPSRVYGFDDDDESATEIVHMRREGAGGRTSLKGVGAEDDEVVVSSQQTGSNRYKPYIPTSGKKSEPEPVLPPPPASNFLDLIEQALAKNNDSSATNAGPEGEDPFRDELPLELDDIEGEPVKPPRRVRGTGEGPVARLSSTPADPLRPSAAPPFTRPPVPPLPSQFGRDAQGGSGNTPANSGSGSFAAGSFVPQTSGAAQSTGDAPVPPSPSLEGRDPSHRTSSGARAESSRASTSASAPAHRADAGGVRASQVYFQRPAKLQERNHTPILLAAGITGLLLLGGYLALQSRDSEQAESLGSGAVAALARGSHPGLLVALNELSAGPSDSREVSDLSTAITWMLWAQEGIKLGEAAPDPKTLDNVQPGDRLPLVVARAERDLLRGDILAGGQRVKGALPGHELEPVLEILLGRFAVERMRIDPTAKEEAIAHFTRALELMSDEKAQKGAPEFPVPKSVALMGLARLESSPEAAAEAFQKVVEADASSLWAALELGRARIPAGASAAVADAAMRDLFTSLRDKLSPRQQAWIAAERGAIALKSGNLSDGMLRLQDAARVDPSWTQPLVTVANLYLDNGQIKASLERLEKAYALAPLNIDVLPAYVEALVEDTRLAAAREVLGGLPDVYQELAPVRRMKARLAREVSDFHGAEAQAAAGLKLAPDDFALKLEQSHILFAQRFREASADPTKGGGEHDPKPLIEALIEAAPGAGRPSAIPLLKAERAVLLEGAERSRAVKEAAAAGSNNARAFLVLAEEALARGDSEAASKLLNNARSAGDLPAVELTLARLDGVVPEKREGAREALRQIVQGRCGDGPVCKEAGKLLDQLH